MPIQAMTVRELVVDEQGQRSSANRVKPDSASGRAADGAAAPAELQARADAEGNRRRLRGAATTRPSSSPVKTGIAGEKYFEVLSGLKDGRPGHHRPVQFGARAVGRRRGEGRAPADAARQPTKTDRNADVMNQFLEAAGIALGAIWANKLRSFMTVLGNIVAVTSIIAVVSLIQGMNASSPTRSSSDVGADTFTIQRLPVITQRRGDEERVRNNPRITLRRRATRSGGSATTIAAVMAAGQQRRRAITYRDEDARQRRRSRASSTEYVDFATFDAERGRLISPTEIDAQAPGRGASAGDTADRLFGAADPARQDDQDRRRATSASSASARRRARLRPVAGRVRGHPARRSFRRCSGRARSLQLIGQAARPDAGQGGDGRRDAWRCGSQRRLQAEASRTTSACSRRTRCSASTTQATSGIFAVLVGVVGAVAGRRRHRHHEHHADGGDRAHARDRPAQGARRAAPRHHLADPDRVGDAVDVRRHRRARCSGSSSRC